MIVQRSNYLSRVQTPGVKRKIPRLSLPDNLLGIPAGKRIDLSPRIMPNEPLYLQMKVRGERNGYEDVFETLLGKDGAPTTDLRCAKEFNTLRGAVARMKQLKSEHPKWFIEASARTRNDITVRGAL